MFFVCFIIYNGLFASIMLLFVCDLLLVLTTSNWLIIVYVPENFNINGGAC